MGCSDESKDGCTATDEDGIKCYCKGNKCNGGQGVLASVFVVAGSALLALRT